MTTVADWARHHGADYWTVGDAGFFAEIPVWVLERCATWINPATDLARLLTARRLLATYSYAVWVDADVVVWGGDFLPLPRPLDAAFARERWMEHWPDGRLRFLDNVSNFVCAFAAGGSFLDRHIADVLAAIRSAAGPLKMGVAGTSLLTRGYPRETFELLDGIGNFSPALERALATGAADDVRAYESGLTRPLVAANLCLSHGDRPFQGVAADAATIPRLVDTLAARRGPLWPSELIGRKSHVRPA
ncbi:hypothetical protein ACLQ2Y_14640 [Micromonospora echinospora]|uniref:hypothetical protein n=1 Tax=Micromonospora echinospora TaxID=1877 RepID=UPI003CF880B2